MRDLLRDTMDTAALVVEVGARFVADAMTERRKAFDDDEAGDYLRCAGADALAESLARCDPDVYGTAVLQPHGFVDFVAEASAADTPRAADDSAAVVPPPDATAAESLTIVALFEDVIGEFIAGFERGEQAAVLAGLMRNVADLLDPPK